MQNFFGNSGSGALSSLLRRATASALLVAMTLVFGRSASAATYYVDFAAGNDANNGTSTSSAWKHCPGDPEATGNAASATPSAGDRIQFRPGVRYFGQIALKSSGANGSNIIYDGSAAGWGGGSGKAIIDGTDALSFARCSGRGNGAGQVQNSNYASIYVAPIPSGTTWETLMIEGSTQLVHSGATEEQTTPWLYGNVEEWKAISSGVTTTTCTDPTFFTQSDSNYWVGAVIGVHVTGNAVQYRTITAFNPSTDTVTFSALSSAPYRDGNWDDKYHYTVLNAEEQLTGPGQYAVDEANDLVYVWPKSSIANVRIGSQTYAFNINGRSYVTIANFEVLGQYGSVYEAGRAITTNTSTATNGVIVEYCDFSGISCGPASAAVYVIGAGTHECYVRNNTMTRVEGRGVFAGGSNVTVQANSFSWVTGTVILALSSSTRPATNMSFIGNALSDCLGAHSNDISFYGLSTIPADTCLIAGNTSIRSRTRYGPFAVSFQHHRNVALHNNAFDGDVVDEAPAAGSSYSKHYNNTVDGLIRIFGAATHSTCEVKNCIAVNGIANNSGENWADIKRSNNGFVTLSFRQSSQYGWSMESGGIQATSANLFVDYAADDFRLSSSSAAINAGADLRSVGISTDVAGMARPVGAALDIGAYEYQGSGSGPQAPSSLILSAVAE